MSFNFTTDYAPTTEEASHNQVVRFHGSELIRFGANWVTHFPAEGNRVGLFLGFPSQAALDDFDSQIQYASTDLAVALRQRPVRKVVVGETNKLRIG